MSLFETLSIAALAATSSFGLVACGGNDGGGGSNADAGDLVETHTKYVVDELTIPASTSEAGQVALDLDGDGIGDNALGGLLGALSSTAGLDLQTGVDEQLVAGDFVLLASVKAQDLENANDVGTYIFFGDNPTPAACTDVLDLTTCGKHLDGFGSFDIAANSPSDAVIVGTLASGSLTAGPGSVSIELPLGAAAIQLDLIAAHIDVSVSANGLSSGKLGGAITEADVDSVLMPAVQELIASLIAENCTPAGDDCGCVTGSSGEQVLSFFDTNNDCEIPLAELDENGLIDATIGNPDLDLLDADGNFNPNVDGVDDSLSVAVGFNAVSAVFDIPAGI
ncbi:MAG: hypothetical protein GY811_08240 [Myxococcales bacterium]|nr:hypothetical protein [Myxococcales bacterium]